VDRTENRMNQILFRWLFLCSLVATGWAPLAHGAEGYAGCNGVIASLPATISSQGVWCLKQNLATAISSGAAITVNVNNVTIDCNRFKLSGTAGLATSASGVYASDRANVTIRRCAIAGFSSGIFLTGASSGGHVIENNRLDGNTYYGIYAQGDGSTIHRNLLTGTGLTSNAASVVGIYAEDSVDVLDNVVSGVSAVGSHGIAYGIVVVHDLGGRINGNVVRGLALDDSHNSVAILISNSLHATARSNDLEGNGGDTGVLCDVASASIVRDNIIVGFATASSVCRDGGGNYSSL